MINLATISAHAQKSKCGERDSETNQKIILLEKLFFLYLYSNGDVTITRLLVD